MNDAFLNGEITEDIYMTQPEGFEDIDHPHHVCKLQKALYGLKQALKAWYDKLKSKLLEWKFQKSRTNSSIFIKHEKRINHSCLGLC